MRCIYSDARAQQVRPRQRATLRSRHARPFGQLAASVRDLVLAHADASQFNSFADIERTSAVVVTSTTGAVGGGGGNTDDAADEDSGKEDEEDDEDDDEQSDNDDDDEQSDNDQDSDSAKPVVVERNAASALARLTTASTSAAAPASALGRLTQGQAARALLSIATAALTALRQRRVDRRRASWAARCECVRAVSLSCCFTRGSIRAAHAGRHGARRRVDGGAGHHAAARPVADARYVAACRWRPFVFLDVISRPQPK